MSNTFDDNNRQPLPRCLDYSAACSLGLLRIIRKTIDDSKEQALSPRVVEDWNNKQSLATAVDFVAEALLINRFDSNEAKKAANYILREHPSSPHIVREMANHFLKEPKLQEGNLISSQNIAAERQKITNIKKSIRKYIRNPMAWSDMAISYAKLGQVEKGRKAMEIALNLGKENRYILRSAARCFLHLGEPDRAIKLLNNSRMGARDPWIASAEIAIAESAGIKSKCISKAKYLVKDDNLTSFSRSELIVGLGTKELNSGSIRKAKALMRAALTDPTENALAQVEWMAKRIGADLDDMTRLEKRVPASYEAETRHLYYGKHFSKSIKAAEKWGRFQPLSSRPIILSSFIAATCLNDDSLALSIIENSLPAQTNDPAVINNQAFSLARIGNIDEAEVTISKVSLDKLPMRQRLIFNATIGLIAMRRGDIERGRKLYSMAIRGFEQNNDFVSAVRALYFWAVEEKITKSVYAASLIEDVKNRINKFNVFELEELSKKL